MDIYVGMKYNSFTRLKEFLGVSTTEILDFWRELTPTERKEWREADLYAE